VFASVVSHAFPEFIKFVIEASGLSFERRDTIIELFQVNLVDAFLEIVDAAFELIEPIEFLIEALELFLSPATLRFNATSEVVDI